MASPNSIPGNGRSRNHAILYIPDGGPVYAGNRVFVNTGSILSTLLLVEYEEGTTQQVYKELPFPNGNPTNTIGLWAQWSFSNEDVYWNAYWAREPSNLTLDSTKATVQLISFKEGVQELVLPSFDIPHVVGPNRTVGSAYLGTYRDMVGVLFVKHDFGDPGYSSPSTVCVFRLYNSVTGSLLQHVDFNIPDVALDDFVELKITENYFIVVNTSTVPWVARVYEHSGTFVQELTVNTLYDNIAGLGHVANVTTDRLYILENVWRLDPEDGLYYLLPDNPFALVATITENTSFAANDSYYLIVEDSGVDVGVRAWATYRIYTIDKDDAGDTYSFFGEYTVETDSAFGSGHTLPPKLETTPP